MEVQTVKEEPIEIDVKEELEMGLYYSDDSNGLSGSDSSSIASDDSDMESNIESLNDFIKLDINNLPTPPERFPFIATPMVHIANENLDMLQYFEYFINEELINLIVTETNRNATESIKVGSKSKYSRNNNWRETDLKEMYVFITLHLLQGIVNKPVLEWYWSKKHSIETPFFRNIMSYERYNLLKTYIYFVNDSEFNPTNHPCPKLYKVWPVIEIVNKLFQSAMTPERDLIMDENNSMHRGSIGVKPIKGSGSSGIPVQTYVICEAKSGYIWSVILYSGKDTLVNKNYVRLLKPTRIVMTLIEPLLDKGYCITSNSFYTSPELADILVKRNTDIVGLVQKGRRDVPTAVKKKLNKGDIIAFQRNKVCIMKWKNQRELTILSTIHNPDFIEVYSKNILTFIPKAISDYNYTMGNINYTEDYMTYCSNGRRRGKRYFYKIFVHLLDQAAWNAFVIYKKQGGTQTHLHFRLRLIDLLIEKYYVPQPKAGCSFGRPASTPNPLRLVERHFLDFIPPTPRKERPTKYCHVCCSRRLENGKRVRRETRFHCSDCKVGLCIPCFKVYHTQPEWKIDK